VTTDTRAIQKRTLQLLFGVQVLAGVGFAVGGAVSALLTADMAGVGVSGLAQSATVVGAALFAIPMTAIVRNHGRRLSLGAGYLVATVGALLVVLAARIGSNPLLFSGFFLFGGATAAGLQARYAALDLAPDTLRGRHVSVVIRGAGRDPAHTLRIVGIVLSLHIAGMHAFAPLTGWLTDRVGRCP
jgi:MFS family permease